MHRFTFRATPPARAWASDFNHLKSPSRQTGILERVCSPIGAQGVLSWIGFLFLIGFLAQAHAASIKLAWDRNPEANVVGYELYYGTAPGTYPNTVDAGNNTTATVSNLQEDTTYYFVVVARNKAGLIGPKSSEVSSRINGIPKNPPKGKITSPDSTVTIMAGERINFEGDASDPNDKTPLTYAWDFGTESGIADSSALNPGNRRFNEPGTYTVTFTVTNARGVSDPTPAKRTIIVKTPPSAPISQTLWKLEFVDSQEVAGYSATNAFDGNPATFWHTQFTQSPVLTSKHEIEIDMGKVNTVNGFEYLSRQDGISVGNIGKYKFYVSLDGKKWGSPVAKGTFDGSAAQKEVYFTPKKGRYVRLRSITEVNGYRHSNVAELNVLRPVSAKSVAPTAQAVSVAKSKSPAALTSGGSVSPSTIRPAAPALSRPLPPTITTEVIAGKKYLAFTIAKPPASDDVKRTIQVSPNLMDWFSGPNHTTVVTDNESILKVRDNTPITRHGKRFIRLKETGP